VEAIRNVELALKGKEWGPSPEEAKSRIFRRSLFAVRDIRNGEILTEENVRSIRPAHGIAPKHLKGILGSKAACDIPRGKPLEWSFIESVKVKN
jgi:pseudaminic acid synthase